MSIPEVCVSVKRDLFLWQKRPMDMAKETYFYGKRDLFIWPKRPTQMSIPEVRVCVSVKRGLPYGERDLLYAQKRPTDILAYLRCANVHRPLLPYRQGSFAI